MTDAEFLPGLIYLDRDFIAGWYELMTGISPES